uniref:Uncharacterized protein n=1 Tax=Arundo donax TaxID=35708 RepID=A0A0A8Z4G1_ARUDO
MACTGDELESTVLALFSPLPTTPLPTRTPARPLLD